MAAINLVVATGRIGREGCGYAMITGQGNGQGAREQGQKCDQLPGRARHREPGSIASTSPACGACRGIESIPHKGLSAVPLLEAIHDGKIKGLLSICFNPTVSLPDGDFIREASRSWSSSPMIDFFMSETARYADVVLPGSLMEEDEGHDDQRRRTGDPPSTRPSIRRRGAREDWRIICDIAARLGAGDKFAYQVAARDLRRAARRLERRRRRLLRHHLGAHRPRDGRLLAVSRRSDHPGTPRLYEGWQVRSSRRQGAFSAGRVAARRRGAGRRVPDHADDGARGVAVSLGHADAPHRRAGRPVSAAAVRDPSAPRREARASRTAISSSVESRRGAVDRARAGREDDPARHGVRPVPLAARPLRQQLHDPRDRSDLEDSRIQDLRGAREQSAEPPHDAIAELEPQAGGIR